MMQRKNKSRSSAAAHHVSSSSSGYDSSSSSNAGAVNDGMLLLPPTATAATTMTIPSTSPSLSMSMSDDDMVGKSNNKNISIINNNIKHNIAEKVKIATVKRYTCGTRPFDKYWLNLDCCGLICASVTYMLHLYAIYSFGWILLPPWFSIMDEDGYRYLTAGCYLHRLLFIGIAILAIFSHFKAMTTDPGAVPPDAHPLSEKEEGEKTRGDWEYEKLDNLIKGEGLHHTHHPHSHHQSFQQQHQLQPTSSANSAINNNHVEQGTAGGIGSNIGANRRMEHSLISSSSLMQEEPEPLDDSKWNNIELPQAAASATATAAVVAASAISTGGVAIAGLVAMAGAGMGASNGSTAAGGEGWEERPGGPCEENFIHSPSSLHHQQQQQRGQRMCRRCHAFKPPRAHHCSICKRCIIKMDHHCPWVNNCVGIGNHKYFLLFIFYTSISCAYSFLLLMYRFCHCIGKTHSHHSYHGPRCVDHPNDLLPLVGLTVEALLFGLFTICMMADQWDVVMTNLTHIDRLKGQHYHHGQQMNQHQHADAYGKLPSYYNQHVGNPMSIMRAGINEVFGTGRRMSMSSSTSAIFPRSRFHYTWLSPLHKVCFPENVRDDIFGYCRPCSSVTSSAGSSLHEGGARRMEMVGRGENMGWGGTEIV